MASATPPAGPVQQVPQPGQKIVGSYVLTQKIGKGSFATVWRGHHKLTGQEVAVKSISRDKLNRNKLQENLESEIAITKKLVHKNIVKLFDIQKTERHIYLVLEYCNSGDLSRLLKSTGQMPESMAHGFMIQLARGLQFLRSHNLIHRDLKPQNLLLRKEGDHVTLKIADFGFARYIQPQSMAETMCGSPLYMAPEILKFQKYDAKADLWSVGTILFQLVAGKAPFQGQNHVQLLQNIEKQEAALPAGLNLSRECQDLLRKLLKRNPIERLSFEEFFLHPWLVGSGPNPSLGNAKTTPSSVSGDGATQQAPVQQAGHHRAGSAGENAGMIGTGMSPGSADTASVGGSPGSLPIAASNRGFSPQTLVSPGTSFNDIPNLPSAFAPGFIATSPATGAIGSSPSSSINGHIPMPRSGLLDPSTSPGSSFKQSIGQTPPTATQNVKPPRTNPFKDRRPTTEYVNPAGRPSENEGRVSPAVNTTTLTPAAAAVGGTNSGNSTEDFVFILSGSDSDKQTGDDNSQRLPSSAGEAAAAPGTSLRTLRAAGERAIAVADIANERSEGGNVAEALVLHVKALDIIHSLLQRAQQYRKSAVLSSHEQSLFSESIKAMQVRFTEQLDRAKKAKAVVDGKSSTVYAEKLIYDRAMELGKDAAVDELLSNYSTAKERYTRAICLLEQLCTSTAMDGNDREILVGHIGAFNKRVDDLLKKESNVESPAARRQVDTGLVF